MNGALLALVLSAHQLSQLPQFSRTTFTVPIPVEKGGGSALGAAGRVEFLREDYLVASNGVSLTFRAMHLQADRVDIDLDTQVAQAEGNVILDEGPRRLAGERLVYSLEDRTGTIYEGKGYVHPDLYINGKEIRKTGEDTYEVIDGVITSCDEEVPDWSFRLSRAKIRVEGFARVYNTRMRVKKLPFLYTPFMMFPAKSERASGLLMPNLGYSQRLGSTVGGAYFQTLGKSYDTTIYADWYEAGYEAVGDEFRYTPSIFTKGIFDGYLIDDPEAGKTRWRVNWEHESSNLPLGMRLVIRHTDFSDFLFFRDFARNFNDITLRQVGSSGFLSGAWGSHTLNILLEQQQSFFGGQSTLERRQLPEISYRLNQTQIGKLPLYFSLAASANSFDITGTDTAGDPIPGSQWNRADAIPSLTAPLSTLPWLSFSLALTGRGTYWDDSLDPEDPSQLSGESLTRTFGSAGAQVVGPSFSRVFHNGIGGFEKFKHIIEPRWDYQYSSTFDFEDQDRVPLFDEVDRIRPLNLYTVSLVNRLLGKPRVDETNPFATGAREIASFTLMQSFSLDQEVPFQKVGDKESQEGPITAAFRFNPSLFTSIDARASYSTLFSNLTSTSLSGRTRIGTKTDLGLAWFTSFNQETGDTLSQQLRVWTSIPFWRQRFLLRTQWNYDVEQQLMQQQSYVLDYFSQCWGIRLETRRFQSELRSDRDIRLSISLKNIGTFIDLNSSTRDRQTQGFY